MVYSSRVIALLLALCVAIITTAFLSLFEGVTQNALIVSFFISGSAAYLFGFVVLEFLIFREIDKIYSLFNKLRRKELATIETEKSNPFNPFKKINEEIFSYATLKQKEIDELKKIETFRREFIADVSHELKTPIFAAQGFVHTLLDGAVKDKSVRNRFLKKAAKSLDGLDMLVQDLLVLSQIETGEIRMYFEYFDIKQMTADILDQFENKADKKDITLAFEPGTSESVTVFGDWQRLNQVITNLLSNGLKYGREGGHVFVGFNEV
ncbi:MAG: histidine kinase dimerization/phospho-acceptor domain-containing protein, partial [Bacteroidota bacterium]